AWLSACKDDLANATARVRPGSHFGAGPTIAKLADWGPAKRPQSVRQAADSIAADLHDFQTGQSLDHVIVLNVASTEPPFFLSDVHRTWKTLAAALSSGGPELLPASAIYALAAIEKGHTYINFTPSLGASLPALEELARTTGSLYAGKDGKTGETLLKTVLAPMFKARNLKVMSWIGHHIFTN